jgi:A/G-specific adenine glycosylase
VHAYSHFRITLHAFRCRLRDGQPRCLDCAALRWVRPADLDGLPMSVADRAVARAVVGPSVSDGQTVESPGGKSV